MAPGPGSQVQLHDLRVEASMIRRGMEESGPAGPILARFDRQGQGQLIGCVAVLLAPQDPQLRGQPAPHRLQPLDGGVTGGTKRNHQRRRGDAGHPMVDHDPIAVLLCGTIGASLAGPMVALQDGLAMSAEMLPVVMLAGQAARADTPADDFERAAGTDEDRLNSFAARAVVVFPY
jgi:hypothetical protein